MVFKILNKIVNSEKHRQEESHAVCVRGYKDGNNAKDRQEHGHSVYFGDNGNSNEK